MISEKIKKYEELLNFEEPEDKSKENIVEKIYEIIENENFYDIFPTYDLHDEELTEDILEVYKVLFWGVAAVVSTLLWLYFFIT